MIFTAATLHVFNLTLNDKHLREAARPRLERCIEWLRVRIQVSPHPPYIMLDIITRFRALRKLGQQLLSTGCSWMLVSTPFHKSRKDTH